MLNPKKSESQEPPLETLHREPTGQRDLNLGVDFGTAFSKLVLRDLSMPGGRRYCFAVAPESCNDQVMAPSVVADDSGHLYFGPQALARGRSHRARLYKSLKARSSLPNGFFGAENRLPDGLTSTDLSALFVCYLLQQGWKAADRYCKQKGAKPRMGFTLGAPVSCLSNKGTSQQFLRLAVSAHQIFKYDGTPDLATGIAGTEARRIIAALGPATVNPETCGDIEDWLRAETLSALMWAYESPQTAPGLYAAVDIGGGTTNASFFKVTERFEDNHWIKRGMAFFGAASSPPGMDKLDLILAEAIGGDNPSEIRGMEADLINRVSDRLNGSLHAVYDEYCSIYKTAFQSAYPKEPKQSVWEQYQLFLIGGGSQLLPLRQCLRKYPPARTPLRFCVDLAPLGTPTDLFCEDGRGFQNGMALFHVAYGLSFPKLEIAPYTGPDQVEPIKASTLLPPVFTHPDPWEEGL
jgi:hypothetical protein